MAGIQPFYYYLTLSLLGVCVVVGIVIALRFQREVEEEATPASPKEVFGPLERAYYAGLMDEAEYLRIRDSMREAGLPVSPIPRKKPKPPSALPPVDPD